MGRLDDIAERNRKALKQKPGLVGVGIDFMRDELSASQPPADRRRTRQVLQGRRARLIRYLATAVAIGASEEAVMPAWLDFLSRRSPATSARLAKEKVALRWKHLLIMQAAITHRLAGRDRGDVGRALQMVVTGA